MWNTVGFARAGIRDRSPLLTQACGLLSFRICSCARILLVKNVHSFAPAFLAEKGSRVPNPAATPIVRTLSAPDFT